VSEPRLVLRRAAPDAEMREPAAEPVHETEDGELVLFALPG
jgi:hypothetical protein